MKKRIMEGRNHLSINFIGVLPAERRQHVGTSLLKYVLKKADEVQLPVFAEVWGKECLSWFQKFDFEVHGDKSLSDKDNVCIYYVVREPRLDPETPIVNTPADPMVALHLEPPREDALILSQDN
jgi:ribosomal protein S18 acetylase RimI-like enzyme